MKFMTLFAAVILFGLTSLSPIAARADDETAKALLGTVLGIIVNEAAKESTTPQETAEDIQWNSERSNQSVPQNNSATNLISDDEIQRNKEIQARLTRIGFYTGNLDGIAGTGTERAIMNWETEFDQSLDGIIDDQEFLFLDKLTNGGFTNRSDYDLAKQAGYSTRKEYLAANNQDKTASGQAVNENPKLAITEDKRANAPTETEKIVQSDATKEGMPKFLKIVIWFSVFFGFIIIIALIKAVIDQGDEYGLRLIFSPQFFILLFGLPFAYFAGGFSIHDSTQGVTNSDLLLVGLSLSIPVFVSYIMNARASNYVFAIAYTLVQLMSIFFILFVIVFYRWYREEWAPKKKYK